MTEVLYRILLVEDEPDLRNVLRTLLHAERYRTIEAATAHRADIEARSHKPDLLIVDLGLPDADGLTVIRQTREWSPVPILVLSARAMEEQKIAALDAGADDYVTKPFSAPELLARVRAGLRRNARGSDQLPSLQIGAVHVDLARRQVQSGQRNVHLTPLEFRLLESLARQAGMIVTHAQLIREVWGPTRQGDTRGLRLCLKHLREKLEPDPARPRYIVTEVGLGYRLCTTPAVSGPDPS